MATILHIRSREKSGVTTSATGPRWTAFLKRHSWGLSTCAFVIAGAGLAYATFDEVDRLTRLRAPTPPEVTTDVIVRNARDDEGNRASFRILLFTDEFRWKMSSHAELESFDHPAFTPEMKSVLARAKEVIVVGASSEEVAPGLAQQAARKKEETRAARRASRIALWVREALTKPIPIRKLNVGHHTSTGGGDDTSDQRRVVIILVLERQDGTNVDEALRAAMTHESVNSPIFKVLLSRYSLATGKSFTWVE